MGEEGFLGANAARGVRRRRRATSSTTRSSWRSSPIARAHGCMVVAPLRHLPAVPHDATAARSRSSAGCRRRDRAARCLLGDRMTEPGTGSDLADVQTRAIRDGDHYVLNGAKTFISNGQIGDLFIVVAKTDPDAEPPHRGISLLLVEADTPGLRARPQARQARPARRRTRASSSSRTAACPVANLLGEEGQGFKMLMEKLQQERLCIARRVDGVVPPRARRHHRLREGAPGLRPADRRASRTRSSSSPSSRPRSRSARPSSTSCSPRTCAATTSSRRSAWRSGGRTDLQKRLTAECLQLHGGYGFMLEYPIATDYADAAVQSIYAGTQRDHEGDHRPAARAGRLTHRARCALPPSATRSARGHARVALVADRVEARVTGVAPGVAFGREHVEAVLADRARACARRSRRAARPGSAWRRGSRSRRARVRGDAGASPRFRWAGRLRSASPMRVAISSGHTTETPIGAPRCRELEEQALAEREHRVLAHEVRGRERARRQRRHRGGVHDVRRARPARSRIGTKVRTPWITPHMLTPSTHS